MIAGLPKGSHQSLGCITQRTRNTLVFLGFCKVLAFVSVFISVVFARYKLLRSIGKQ